MVIASVIKWRSKVLGKKSVKSNFNVTIIKKQLTYVVVYNL